MTTQSYVDPSDVVAVILAGGKGERLGGLTWYRGKPAVLTGDTMMISHASSSAINSGIERVVVAVQYLPLSIERFFSDSYGSDFGPEKRVQVIGPYHTMKGAAAFDGTAHALSNALSIAKRTGKKYLLVLSGDHVYNYRFNDLFENFHTAYDPESVVLLAQSVKPEEVSDFGIIQTEPGKTKVTGFLEKPKLKAFTQPIDTYSKNLGIYFGNIEVWERELSRELEISRESGRIHTDIAGHVMVRLTKEKRVPLNVFNSDFFWADVGQVSTYYNVLRNIFLDRNPDIYGDPKWQIKKVEKGGKLHQSDGTVYFATEDLENKEGELNGSIISPWVHIDRARVVDSLLLGGLRDQPTHIRYNSVIENTIVDKLCGIGPNAVITSKDGIVVVVRETHIPINTRIEAEGHAIVADPGEMRNNLSNLKSYDKHMGGVELFAPNGRKITLEELAA